ncbi:MAG: PqiC family protein [Steroidobacteraceae bacterium]
MSAAAYLRAAAASVALLVAACASAPDRFYTLHTMPESAGPASAHPSIHMQMAVTIPVLVDRAELVVDTSSTEVQLLDHERWGAPLSDQVARTLAGDIELRRPDILVGDHAYDQSAAPTISVKVDIVRMSVRRGGPAQLEAHWRIVDKQAGIDKIDTATFAATPASTAPAGIVDAYSETLSALAARLVDTLRAD